MSARLEFYLKTRRAVRVSVTKALTAAAAYAAEDVLSESATVGTVWTFAAVVPANGGKGYIVKAQVISETNAITPLLTLFLFNATPTSVINDNLQNTALLHADLANYVGKIEFPALAELNGDSEAIVTPSTAGELPLRFECASGANDLIGILVTADAFTQVATEDMTVVIVTEPD